MQVISISTRPREAIRNAEILYSLEWQCIRAGEEEAWKTRVEEELGQLKTFRREGRLRYEAALQAHDHEAIQHINVLRYELETWIRRLEQSIRESNERKRQQEVPPVIVPPPKPSTTPAPVSQLEDITATTGIRQVTSIADIRRMYGFPASSVEKPFTPAKTISLKPLLVPLLLLALIWFGTSLYRQQSSQPNTNTVVPPAVNEVRDPVATFTTSNPDNTSANQAAPIQKFRIAEIDATEDAVINRVLRKDDAKRFKALWIFHEYYLNQFWQDNFSKNWAYRNYLPPEEIRLFDQYAEPLTRCKGEGDIGQEIAFYCPADRIIYVNAKVMADEFRKGGAMLSVMSLAHEWGHHIQELNDFSLNDVQQELQADCFAGAYIANARFLNHITANDFNAIVSLMSRMGDRYGGERTHGSSYERTLWFDMGFINKVSGCLSGF